MLNNSKFEPEYRVRILSLVRRQSPPSSIRSPLQRFIPGSAIPLIEMERRGPYVIPITPDLTNLNSPDQA